eukprot:890171-Rhodomonas_salina.1
MLLRRGACQPTCRRCMLLHICYAFATHLLRICYAFAAHVRQGPTNVVAQGQAHTAHTPTAPTLRTKLLLLCPTDRRYKLLRTRYAMSGRERYSAKPNMRNRIPAEGRAHKVASDLTPTYAALQYHVLQYYVWAAGYRESGLESRVSGLRSRDWRVGSRVSEVGKKQVREEGPRYPRYPGLLLLGRQGWGVVSRV